ncbi:MAG: hypothetical protein OEL66_03130, partial [Desulfobulbaceae bacterium]|nr:hypothetical protein [Desulfobulbaceae bacterium]
MHKLKILFVLLAIFGSFSSVSFARSTENAEKISFNFNNVDIRSVIKSVSKITGKSFIIDPEVNGSVTIVSSEEINTDDVYDIFISILELHGYVTSSEGGLTKIVSATKGKQYVSLDKGGSMGEDPGDQFIVKLYKINYIPADDVISVLRPLTSTNGYLASHKESNMLIMVDRADNIKRIIDIIKRIDQAATGETELIHLQHASAANIVAVIESLEKNQPANTRTNLRLIADERSNGILISGDPANVLRVKALIAKLDAPVENEGSTQVIFLHYARAKDLLPILVGLASGTSSGANQGGAKQNTVSIQADEGSNALIITANPAKMKSMQSVLRALDIRRAQLMIEAIIAEVSTDNASELGVQWRSTDEVGASNKAVVGGTNFSANGSGINQLSSNPLGVGDGLSVGFFNGTTKI